MREEQLTAEKIGAAQTPSAQSEGFEARMKRICAQVEEHAGQASSANDMSAWGNWNNFGNR